MDKNQIKVNYNQYKKIFAYVSGDIEILKAIALKLGIEIYIDLADYYSAMYPSNPITEEGANGYITIWINGKAGLENKVPVCSLFPVGMGITDPVSFNSNIDIPDQNKSFDFSLMKLKTPFVKKIGRASCRERV